MKRLVHILTITGWLLCLFCAPRVMAQTGAVMAFGYNASGELGDGTTIYHTLPVPAQQISGIKAISCGFNHTLALDSTGIVWAWGNNGQGQLGTGDTLSRIKPVAVLGGIKAISAGGYHSLALDYSGRVWVWGHNAGGQLGMGTGDFTQRLYPTLMNSPFNTRIKAITAGGWHSLILDDQGMLYGCGSNDMGQLAQHNFTPRLPAPVFITRFVKAMAAGYGHTLIQTSYNSVMAAGWNGYGQIGDGTINNGTINNNRNYLSFCTNNARSIGAGYAHSLVIRQDGRVLAWGRNDYGALGTNDTAPRLVPTLMLGVANIKEVAGGFGHSLMLADNGNVLAVGLNTSGQLGDGTTANHSIAVVVKNASLVGSIAAGLYHSVILKPFTKTMVTGRNDFGQLGIGSSVQQQNAPVQMASGNNIIAVASGPVGNHSLMLKADGSVWASGWNAYGQLGINSTTDSKVPVRVKGPGGFGFLSGIIAIAAGDLHSMALDVTGTLYTWGYNGSGALGQGDTTDRFTPTQVPIIHNIFAIAAGGYHSMILADDGWVGVCGSNYFGQLGLGDTTPRTSFARISGSFGQTALIAGEAHSMSLDYFSGGLLTWGVNSYGNLGLGDALTRYTPTYKQGTIASVLGSGGVANMHINARGEVFVAGFNNLGGLGLGDTTNRLSWTYNPYVTAATAVTGGYLHSLFLNVYGDVYASGYGGYGQLGNGGTANALIPNYVAGAPYATSIACGAYHSLMLTTPRVDLASLTISPATVTAGSGATGTVTLTGLAGPGGQRFSLYSNDSAVTVPAYVDVAQASKTATFPITTNKNLAVRKVVTIYVYKNNQVSATLTVNPWVLQQ